MDAAREYTDREIRRVARELVMEYGREGDAAASKVLRFLTERAGDDGLVPESALQGREWARLRSEVARQMSDRNRESVEGLHGELTKVRDLTAGDAPAASKVPRPAIDRRRDLTWNERHVEAAARAAVGRDPEVAARGVRGIADMNRNAAVRRARTAINGAENAGRMDAMLARGGSKRWVAVMDERTRVSHASINGEVVSVGEPFSNGLMYPGDPSGPPEEVYNCRCTMEWVDAGISVEASSRYDGPTYDGTLKDGDGGYRVFERSDVRYDRNGQAYYQVAVSNTGETAWVPSQFTGAMSFEEANEMAVGRDWWSEVSPDSQKVFKGYQASSAAINGQLRTGDLTPSNVTKVRKMEAALDEAEVAVPFVAQREANSALLGFDRQATVEDIRGMIGDVVTDQAFMSCSPISNDSLSFSGRFGVRGGMGTDVTDRVEYHIQIPTGEGVGGVVGTHTMAANEFILNRGSRLRVVGAYEVDGTVHCNLQWVGRDPEPLKNLRRKK